jgi:phage gpG-like protein
VVRIYITSHGFEYIERSYRAAAGRARMLSPALELVAEDMIEDTKMQFESGGRRGGGSWKFPSRDQMNRKMKRGQDPRPLFQSHRLFESLTQRGDEEMILEIGSNGIRYGSRTPYAETHQFGDPSRNIPARPFIKFLESDIERWGEIILTYITDPMQHG